MKNWLLFFLIGLISCNDHKKKAPVASPPGYDLKKPIIIKLPLQLDEISGVSYYAKDKSLFAISDEKGFLFKIIPYPELSVKVWKFSKKADFEDLVLLNSTFYILQSNGNLHLVNFTGRDTISTNEASFSFKGSIEFETLFYDPVSKMLKLVCKTADDAKKKLLNIYTYDPAKNAFSDSVSYIDMATMFVHSGEKPFHVKVSAGAVHPITGEIYLVSSVNKLLIILDKNYVLKSYYPLTPSLFKQPEGLSFSENGTLIISNESAQTGSANLLLFNYQK